MQKRTRTILFVVFAFLFLLAAPVIVLYSEGYRYDFEKNKVVQVGAFYFKVLPKSAEVYLNGKLETTTSMFAGATLIEGLLPKTYNIEIKKQGYHAWSKNLEIKEKQVTESKNIMLFPEDPAFTVSASSTKAIQGIISEIEISATSTDKNKIVGFNNYEIWITYFKEEPKEKVFITRFSEKISQVLWLTDNYLVFNVGDKIKIAEIDIRDKINIIDLREFKYPEIFLDQNKLYILSQGKLYLTQDLLP